MYKAIEKELKGKGVLEIKEKLFSDTSITQTDFDLVEAYTGIGINHINKKITITENRDLCEIYDFAKNDKIFHNLEQPSIDKFLIEVQGKILDFNDYEIEVNGVTLSSCDKFTDLKTTGNINILNSGTITTNFEDSDEVSFKLEGTLNPNSRILIYDTTLSQEEINKEYTASKTNDYFSLKKGHNYEVELWSYNKEEVSTSFSNVVSPQSLSFIQLPDTTINDNDFSYNSVSSYSGISIDHTTKQIDITQNRNLDELYHYFKYDKTSQTGINYPTRGSFFASKAGSILDIADYDLKVDGATLSSGTTFTKIETSNDITKENSGLITADFEDSDEVSFILEGTLNPHTRILIYDTTSSQEIENNFYSQSKTNDYFTLNKNNDYEVELWSYNKEEVSTSFSNVVSPQSLSFIQLPDTTINDNDFSYNSVSSYSGISIDHTTKQIEITQNRNLDELYHYFKYDKTSQTGINYPTRGTFFASKAGSILDILDYTLNLNSATLSSGTTFTKIETSNDITKENSGLITADFEDSDEVSFKMKGEIQENSRIYIKNTNSNAIVLDKTYSTSQSNDYLKILKTSDTYSIYYLGLAINTLKTTYQTVDDPKEFVFETTQDLFLTNSNDNSISLYGGISTDYENKILSITENRNLCEIYDYLKYKKYTSDIEEPSLNEFVLEDSFGSFLNVKDYTINVNGVHISTCDKFSKIKTSSTFNLEQGATSDVTISDSRGVSVSFTSKENGYKIAYKKEGDSNPTFVTLEDDKNSALAIMPENTNFEYVICKIGFKCIYGSSNSQEGIVEKINLLEESNVITEDVSSIMSRVDLDYSGGILNIYFGSDGENFILNKLDTIKALFHNFLLEDEFLTVMLDNEDTELIRFSIDRIYMKDKVVLKKHSSQLLIDKVELSAFFDKLVDFDINPIESNGQVILALTASTLSLIDEAVLLEVLDKNNVELSHLLDNQTINLTSLLNRNYNLTSILNVSVSNNIEKVEENNGILEDVLKNIKIIIGGVFG